MKIVQKMILAMCLSLSTASQAAELLVGRGTLVSYPFIKVPFVGFRHEIKDNVYFELESCIAINMANIYYAGTLKEGKYIDIGIKLGGGVVRIDMVVGIDGMCAPITYTSFLPKVDLEFSPKNSNLSLEVSLANGWIGLRYGLPMA